MIQTVTPCVGVWIETYELRNAVDYGSHTLRGCVDWNLSINAQLTLYHVTPCVGVWIETCLSEDLFWFFQVTPCVGVWIETSIGLESYRSESCHTLRGCVDWNLKKIIFQH